MLQAVFGPFFDGFNQSKRRRLKLYRTISSQEFKS